MNINVTLFGQMITFAIFVWFTMKFVWPPMMAALAERQKKIAEGLAAAERGHEELRVAQDNALTHLREAKDQAAKIVEMAQQKADQIIVDAQQKAKEEAARLQVQAQEEIKKEAHKARAALQARVVEFAVAGAEKILQRNIDSAANQALLDQLARGME